MADMSLDELLSSSIKSAAEPAASKGVADAIRARVAAGDTGTAVAGSTAPGWGGGAGSAMTIVAPIALIVVAGVVGGALGASGLLGGSAGPVGGDGPAYVNSSETAPIYSCPGGPQVGAIPASTRVLAVARDADGAFLGARDPGDLTSTIWFETGDLVLDADSPDPGSLPVEECPEVTVTVVTPTPTPTPEPTEEPQPPRDTTAPTITKFGANPMAIYSNGCVPNTSTVSAFDAADDVGVTGVQATWAGGSAELVKSGNSWSFVYAPVPNYNGNVPINLVARDAAGNQSAPKQVVIQVTNVCVF